MVKKWIFAGVALLSSSYLCAAIEITVSSVPELPFANLIQNASFEEGGLASWKAIKGHEAAVVLDPTSSASGNASIRIDSTSETSPGAFQRVKFPMAMPAGTPLFIRLSGRKQDGDIDSNPGSVALQMFFDDQTRQYLSMPVFPSVDYDWLSVENVIELPKASSAGGTIYLCHYKQEGKQWFDDITLIAGTVQLTAVVQSSEAIRQIRVWSSKHGVVYDSAVLPEKRQEFQKTFELPAYATYYVEVIDEKGNRAGKVYPDQGDVNIKATPDQVPVFPLNRMVLTYGKPEVFSVDLPEIAGKKGRLELSARLQQRNLAGYTGALQIKVNGQVLGEAELLKPNNRLMTANGKESKFTTNRGYVVYYSPAFFALSREIPYCPVSEPDQNPFNYKLDISKYVRAGENSLEMSCMVKAPQGQLELLIENARIILE